MGGGAGGGGEPLGHKAFRSAVKVANATAALAHPKTGSKMVGSGSCLRPAGRWPWPLPHRFSLWFQLRVL